MANTYNPLTDTAASVKRALDKIVGLLNPETNYVATANRILEINSSGKMSGVDIYKPGTTGGATASDILPTGTASVGTPAKFYLDHVHPARYKVEDDTDESKTLVLGSLQYVQGSGSTIDLQIPTGGVSGDFVVVKCTSISTGAIRIFPPSGGQIDTAGVDTPLLITGVNQSYTIVAASSTLWYII